jgi:XTP/dITP diphosphohydrolase
MTDQKPETKNQKPIVVATTNVKKGGEMEAILTAALPELVFVRLSEFPEMPEVEETGETFMENAHLKARATAQHTGLIAIADDGGFVVDALDGAPGVKSHRFLGENTPFEVKMTRILEMLQDVPEEQRTCRFECAVVIAMPTGETWECRGICEGRVAHEMRGSHGFGYDPIFFYPPLGKHMAELIPEEKHKISHRGKALACATERLREAIQSHQ